MANTAMQAYAKEIHRAAVRAALFVAILLAITIGAAMGAQGDNPGQDARVLLRRMLVAEQKRAYLAREITYVVISGKQSEQVVKRDPKRGQRTEFIRPAGDVLIDNYKQSWFYSPRGNRLVVRESRLTPLRSMTHTTIKAIERGDLQARWDGSDQVAGRDADIVRVSPPASARASSRRFWIDRKTGLRLKTEEIAPQGRVLSSSYFVSLDLSPHFDSDDFKDPKPLPGMTVEHKKHRSYKTVESAQKDVSFPIRKPTGLPEGFTLKAVSVVTLNDSRMVVQRFANGLNLLTFFQTNADITDRALSRLDGRSASGSGGTRGPRAHTWRDGGIAFALVGNLPQTKLQSIAASVK